MPQPLVNGTAYSWSQIECRIIDTPVSGITSISYSEEQEMQDNFGAGNRPVSRGYGKITTEASIKLEMATVLALQNASPNGTLQGIPEFPIIISWLPDNGVIVTDTLNNCRFKKNMRDTNQGDMTTEVDLELMVSHITWNGA